MLFIAVAASGQEEATAAAMVDRAERTFNAVIEALGGEKFLGVQDITRRGRLYSFSRGELSSPGERFLDYVKFSDKERLELGDKERLELGKKGKIVYLYNEEEGWELDKQGIRDMSPEAIEDFLENNRRDFEYLMRFQARGEKVNIYYLGREFVDNRRTHILELVDERGESTKLIVDANTNLPMQLRYRERHPVTGDWIDVVEYFGKYVNVGGVETPMQFTRERAGNRSLEAYFSDVQYNTGISDELFTRTALEQHWQKVK
jgi:outer membrane lipoprotein-sorting protein